MNRYSHLTWREKRMLLDAWLYNFAEDHPIGIWVLAAVTAFILFVPLAMFVNWLSGRP